MAKLWRQADVWIWGSWIHPADTYSSHRWPWTLSSGILSSCRYAKAMLWTQFHIKTVVLKQLAVALTATMIWDGVRLRRTLAFFGRPFVKTVRPMLSVRCLSVLSCLSVTFVHCGPTVGRIRMKLGVQVGLCPGHIVLDGNPAAPPPKGHSLHPIFGPYLLRPNGCMDQDATWYGARPQPRGLCVRWGPSPLNFQPMLIIVIVISLEHCTGVRRYWFVQVQV